MTIKRHDSLNDKCMSAQPATDFMVAYGIALVIISVAIYIIFSTSIFNPNVLPPSCTPAPSFVCNHYTFNTSTNNFTIQLSQATGSMITINGAACSSSANALNASLPAYGNVQLLSNAVAPSFYPPNGLPNGGLSIASGASGIFSVYCYSGSGIAFGKIGNSFIGALWINYTTVGLPGNNIMQVAQFTVPYT